MDNPEYKIGDLVLYIPNHATGPDDPICERGTVSNVTNKSVAPNTITQLVWVRYNGSTGQLTPTRNLVKL